MDLKQLLLVLGGFFLLLTALLVYSVFSASGGSGVSGFSKCVAVVKVQGEIVSSSSSGFFDGASGVSSEEISDELKQANQDPSVAGVFVDINSPGGSAVASKEIFDAIRDLEKPSLAYIGEVGASGGYYAASASDYVVVNPNGITGSIGAIASLLNYAELFEKLGLREENIKSGGLKDMGSGSRNLTDEERIVLGGIINETFENFEADVREAREGKLTYYYEEINDGRILSAKSALGAGLVDEIAVKKKALEKAAQLSQVKLGEGGEVSVCEFSRKKGLSDLLASFSAQSAQAFFSSLGKSFLPQNANSMKLEYSLAG